MSAPLPSSKLGNEPNSNLGAHSKLIPNPYSEEALNSKEIYAESAIWLCRNRKTGFKTRISGALAEILQKYPKDYKLRLLALKEICHEHPATTGQ